MKISLTIPEEFTVTNHGYGIISQQIVHTLQRLGHTVPWKDPSAQVELAIGQPYNWVWSSRDSYKIGLAAWESTKIPRTWRPGLHMVDELWTPSPVIADVFKAEGYPAKVYEHGVGEEWIGSKRRSRDGKPIRFLHIGEPAPRKGGQLTYDVFKELFGNSDKATLTIKAFSQNTIRGKNNAHIFKESRNVKVITEIMEEEALVDLVKRHDVLVYPSYGEGFGLIPLQAMATGMPVICTEAWAPYKQYLLPQLRVDSRLADSPWSIHTGQMWHPDRDSLARAMQHAADEFPAMAAAAYDIGKYIPNRYNWERLTEKAFAPIVNMIESKNDIHV